MTSNINEYLKFPENFEISASWVENINDRLLLQLALSHPSITKNTILKQLIANKISYLISNSTVSSQQITLAKSEKETGNNFMKSQLFEQSITHYTYSIISNPKESTTYCNRALAYYKMNKFDKSIQDCTQAIELNNSYMKAFYRRALCYIALKKYNKAYDDLLYLFNTKNSNDEIDNTLKVLLENWKKDTGDNYKNIEKDLEEKIKVAKEGKLNMDKPWELKGDLLQMFVKWNKSAEIVKKSIIEHINKKEFNKASEIAKTCLEQCKDFISKFSDKTKENVMISKSIIELEGLKAALDYANILFVKSNSKPDKKNYENFYKTSLLSKEQREKAAKIAEKDLDFSDFGKSAYGFEKAYNSFKDRDDKFYEFLKYFEGKTISSVYKNSEMSVNVINGIIKIFRGVENLFEKDEDILLFVDYLTGIKDSKSFGLVKNFIKKKDKEFIKENCEKIIKKDDKYKEQCEGIIKEFS